MCATLKRVSYNIDGLSSARKCKLLWDYVYNVQPDVAFLHKHNQHTMAGQMGVFASYHIFYVGHLNYSGVCALVRHELQPILFFDDPASR